MCALLWNIMTWFHHDQITLRARHIPGCLNVMVRPSIQSSLEWPVHPQMFKQIYQVVHSSVDLFTTHLKHKVPLYISPIPVQHAWDMDALNINWSGLTAYTYPPMALLHRAIHVKQNNCLINVMTPGWPGMPWLWDLVQLLTGIPLQLPVSTTSQPPCLVSRSGWLQGRSFSVEVAERIFCPSKSSTRIIYKSSGPYKI